MTVEIDVVADDALDRAVRRAVEHGIEAVSRHAPKVRLAEVRRETTFERRHFS